MEFLTCIVLNTPTLLAQIPRHLCMMSRIDITAKSECLERLNLTVQGGRSALPVIVLLLLFGPLPALLADTNRVDATASAQVAGCGCHVRAQDEFWIVSSRHLGGIRADNPSLKCLQYIDHRWETRTVDEFLSTGRSETGFVNHQSEPMVTMLYVHGNQTDQQLAQKQGWSAYRRVVFQNESHHPVRFVIWSWPSTKRYGPIKDVRAKAARADIESYYLGWMISRLPPSQPTSLIGYSFGARVILGALNLNGGGTLLGRRLETPSTVHVNTSPQPAKVALLASATHNYWLAPNRRHGEAYSRIQKLLLVNNSTDRALRFYPFLEANNKPMALGQTGLAGRGLLPDKGQKIRQVDVSEIVGIRHSFDAYLDSSRIVNELQRGLLWETVPHIDNRIARSGADDQRISVNHKSSTEDMSP